MIIVSSKALKIRLPDTRELRAQKTDCSSAVFGGKQKKKVPSSAIFEFSEAEDDPMVFVLTLRYLVSACCYV